MNHRFFYFIIGVKLHLKRAYTLPCINLIGCRLLQLSAKCRITLMIPFVIFTFKKTLFMPVSTFSGKVEDP